MLRFLRLQILKVKPFPVPDRQLIFADQLAGELREIGLSEVTRDEFGYVTATLPSNQEKLVPVIGFISHMDYQSRLFRRKCQSATGSELPGTGFSAGCRTEYDFNSC